MDANVEAGPHIVHGIIAFHHIHDGHVEGLRPGHVAPLPHVREAAAGDVDFPVIGRRHRQPFAVADLDVDAAAVVQLRLEAQVEGVDEFADFGVARLLPQHHRPSERVHFGDGLRNGPPGSRQEHQQAERSEFRFHGFVPGFMINDNGSARLLTKPKWSDRNGDAVRLFWTCCRKIMGDRCKMSLNRRMLFCSEEVRSKTWDMTNKA